MAPIRSATKWTTHKKGLPMTKVRINQRLSLSLWAKNRSHRKEQSCYRSALSSAPCRRSGRSPALPYPPHEWDYSTISLFHPALRGHLYFANQGTFLLCIDRYKFKIHCPVTCLISSTLTVIFKRWDTFLPTRFTYEEEQQQCSP
jgi:hypothetical protein